LAIAGGDEYNLNFLFAIQLQFQLDVNNLAFVLIFIISNSIRLRFRQTIFKCPAIANALPLQAMQTRVPITNATFYSQMNLKFAYEITF